MVERMADMRTTSEGWWQWTDLCGASTVKEERSGMSSRWPAKLSGCLCVGVRQWNCQFRRRFFLLRVVGGALDVAAVGPVCDSAHGQRHVARRNGALRNQTPHRRVQNMPAKKGDVGCVGPQFTVESQSPSDQEGVGRFAWRRAAEFAPETEGMDTVLKKMKEPQSPKFARAKDGLQIIHESSMIRVTFPRR